MLDVPAHKHPRSLVITFLLSRFLSVRLLVGLENNWYMRHASQRARPFKAVDLRGTGDERCCDESSGVRAVGTLQQVNNERTVLKSFGARVAGLSSISSWLLPSQSMDTFLPNIAKNGQKYQVKCCCLCDPHGISGPRPGSKYASKTAYCPIENVSARETHHHSSTCGR